MAINQQQFRQFGSLFIFGVLIVSSIKQIRDGSTAAEWNAMNADERYYFGIFKKK